VSQLRAYIVMALVALGFVAVSAVVVEPAFAVVLAFIFLVTGLLSLIPLHSRTRRKDSPRA
jgi:hypothetical protein